MRSNRFTSAWFALRASCEKRGTMLQKSLASKDVLSLIATARSTQNRREKERPRHNKVPHSHPASPYGDAKSRRRLGPPRTFASTLCLGIGSTYLLDGLAAR